jgi:hypothetical protein
MKGIAVELKAKYRGFKIEFHEYSKHWSVTIDKDTLAYQNEDLDKVKDYVDKVLKSDFKPFEAISTSGYETKYRKVLVTSVDLEGDVWIQEIKNVGMATERKTRSKVGKEHIIAITPENEATIKAIQDIDTQAGKLQDRKEDLEKKLTHPAL